MDEDMEEEVESGGGTGAEGLWSPVLAHPAHGRGVYPVAKVIVTGSGSNKFCLVLGACAQ